MCENLGNTVLWHLSGQHSRVARHLKGHVVNDCLDQYCLNENICALSQVQSPLLYFGHQYYYCKCICWVLFVFGVYKLLLLDM